MTTTLRELYIVELMLYTDLLAGLLVQSTKGMAFKEEANLRKHPT
jgi:hypothetical protein